MFAVATSIVEAVFNSCRNYGADAATQWYPSIAERLGGCAHDVEGDVGRHLGFSNSRSATVLISTITIVISSHDNWSQNQLPVWIWKLEFELKILKFEAQPQFKSRTNNYFLQYWILNPQLETLNLKQFYFVGHLVITYYIH